MKTIALINWIIIAIYGIYAIFIYFDSKGSGMDAAGRGMAMGFLFVGLIYLAVLAGLNFINVMWVRVVVLFLGGLPLIYFALQSINSYQAYKNYDKKANENSKYKDPHLNAMMEAITKKDVKNLESLLARDNSQINKIGETNRKTLLDVATRNAWVSETSEARDIVHLLLKNGADPNVFHKDRYGSYAPLATYGVYLDVSIFQALLEAGADPNAVGENYDPLLYTLIDRRQDDNYEKVKLLLEFGLDPNLPLGDAQPYQLNYNPLIWAAHHERWKTCSLLIEHGTDINFEPSGPDGRTFWQVLAEKGAKYEEEGNTPESYQDLLLNETIQKNRNANN